MDLDKKPYKLKGDRVRRVRKFANLTREQLADAIYCDESTIASVEQGRRNLTPQNAERIAEVCGVSSDYLNLKSDFMTRYEAVKDAVNKMQNDDAMWTAFLKHIALYAGYELKEANREGTTPTDVNAPYINFKNQDAEEYMSMREVNDFIDDIERYAEMRLKILFERKGRE